MYRKQADLSGATNLDNFMNEKDAPDCEYIGVLIELTKNIFINKNGIPPVFLFEKEGQINHVQVPNDLVGSDSGKDELASLIETAIQTFKPESFCFVSEAWIYNVKDLEKEEAKQAIAEFKKGITNINVVREECVTFAFTQVNSDGSHSRRVGSMPFHRGADDKICKFDSVRWIKEEGEKKLEGRLVF
jgi:hypothetical protein